MTELSPRPSHPPPVADPPPTADPVPDSAESACIAAALEGLRDLDELPVVEHVARFDAVHESLTAALSTIDEV